MGGLARAVPGGRAVQGLVHRAWRALRGAKCGMLGTFVDLGAPPLGGGLLQDARPAVRGSASGEGRSEGGTAERWPWSRAAGRCAAGGGAGRPAGRGDAASGGGERQHGGYGGGAYGGCSGTVKAARLRAAGGGGEARVRRR